MSDSNEPQNLYASSGIFHFGASVFDFRAAFSLVITAFKTHYLKGSVSIVILFVAGAFLSYCVGLIHSAIVVSITGEIISTILNYLVQVYLSFGFIWLGISAVQTLRGTDYWPLEYFSKGADYLTNLLLVNFITSLISLVVMIPGILLIGVFLYVTLGATFFKTFDLNTLSPFGNAWLALPPMILGLLLPPLFVLLRFSLAIGLVVDKERSPVTAMKDSWTLTEGVWTHLFLYYLAWGLIIIVCVSIIMVLVVFLQNFIGLFALIIAVLFGFIPLTFMWSLVFGSVYKQLTAV